MAVWADMIADSIAVLLVEDNPGDVRLIRELISEQRGDRFVMEVAKTLAAGVQRAVEVQFDVILLDLSLPDGQGIDAFAGMVRAAPEVPIIILTGDDDRELAGEMVGEGAQGLSGEGADRRKLVGTLHAVRH